MSIVRRAAENSFFIFITEIIIRVITFFVSLLLIRYLGAGNFGNYSLVYAFLAFFEVFVNMGIEPIVVRELSRDEIRGAQFLGSAVTLKFFFSLIGLFLCWAAILFMRYPLDIKILIYLASLSMPFSFGTLFSDIFHARLSMKYVNLIMVGMKICLAILTLIFIFLKAGLFTFIFLNLLVYLAQIVFIYYQSRRFLTVKISVDLGIWKELLKASWPIAVNVIFVSIYTRIDQIMLFNMKGSSDLGFYAAAVKLAELPTMFLGVFMVSVSPLFFKYAKTSQESLKTTYRLSFKYLMMLVMPIAIMATLYPDQIILRCYGASFHPSELALAILIWGTVFIYIGTINSNLLIAMDLQRFDMLFTGTLLVTNVLLNLVLIPKYSFVGAAAATAISYSFLVPLAYSLKRTRGFAKVMLKSMIKPLALAWIAGYLAHFIPYLDWTFKLVISGFIYLFLIFLIKEIDATDIKYLKEILTKPNP